MNKLGYLIRESIRGWSTHRQVTLPTLLTVGLCTFILVGSFLILQAIWNFQLDSESRWRVEVFLHMSSDQEYQDFGDWLRKDPATSGVKFVSPELAWKRFQKDFGPELLQELDENPLPASWEFHVSKDHQSSFRLSALTRRIQSQPIVDEVNSSSESLQMIENWGLRLKLTLSMVVLFLTFMIWLILKNSVKMSLYSRQVLVENMKYLGASESFISFPFILESLIQSLIACVLSFLSWQFIFEFISVNLPMIGEIFVMDWGLFFPLWLGLSFLGLLTSWRTVQTYLRETWEG